MGTIVRVAVLLLFLLSCADLCGDDEVHRIAVRAFDPDFLDLTFPGRHSSRCGRRRLGHPRPRNRKHSSHQKKLMTKQLQQKSTATVLMTVAPIANRPAG